MTLATGTLFEKNFFSEDDFLVRRDEMYQSIGEMTMFLGTEGTYEIGRAHV